MALRYKNVVSKPSNKESAAITAAGECREIVGKSEEAYSMPRALHSVTKWRAEVVSCKCAYQKRCRISG